MTTAALTCPSHSLRRTSRSKGTPRAGLSPEQRQFCSAVCPAAAILEWRCVAEGYHGVQRAENRRQQTTHEVLHSEEVFDTIRVKITSNERLLN